MTDDEVKALREAAEAVVAADYGVSCGPYDDACEAFNLVASPAAVLRLLAELDEANETARMYADALAAVKAEREALRAAHDTVLADLCARTEERDASRAALTFYADVSKYPAPLTGGMGALWVDCGDIARAALGTPLRTARTALDTTP